MVTKREVAEAQQLLNEAVGNAIVQRRNPVLGQTASAWLRVETCYDQWRRLRNELDGQGLAVARSTSIAAAKSNIMGKQSLRRTILQVIVGHWDHFGWGMTTDEVQGRLRGKHQSVSARISELVNTYGLLVDTGKKAETSSGAKAILWGPTPEAIELVHAAYRGAE